MTTMTKKKTVTKKELISTIARENDFSSTDVRCIIQAFLDKMRNCLSKGSRLEFRDFGVFEIVKRKQKIGRNPKKASDPIVIPERHVVKWTPGKKMRQLFEEDFEL